MYVNRDFKSLSVDKKKLIECGIYGKIFSADDDKIIKAYFNETPKICKLDDDVFSIIKDIKHPNLVEIYDVYTTLFHYYTFSKNRTEFLVDAYVAKHYQEARKNILWDSKEYLLENIYALEALIHELSNSAILVGRLSKKDSVFTDSHIIIADPDFFSHSTLSSKENQNENIVAFLEYLAFLFINELIAEENENKKDYSEIEKNIFFENIRLRTTFANSDKSIADEFSKALRFHRSPMEFFTKGE